MAIPVNVPAAYAEREAEFKVLAYKCYAELESKWYAKIGASILATGIGLAGTLVALTFSITWHQQLPIKVAVSIFSGLGGLGVTIYLPIMLRRSARREELLLLPGSLEIYTTTKLQELDRLAQQRV